MKKFFGILIFAVLGVLLFFFVFLPQILSQSEIQNYLKSQIRGRFGDQFEVEAIGAGFFPSAFVEAKGLKIYLAKTADRRPIFEARKARIYLKIFPLIFKRLEAKHLEFEGGSVHLRVPKQGRGGKPSFSVIRLTDVNGTLRRLSFTAPSPFKLRGNLYENGGSFRADGAVRMSLEKLKVKLMDLSSRFEIRKVSWETLVRSGWLDPRIPVDQGEFDLQGSFSFEPESRNVNGKAALSVSELEFRGKNRGKAAPVSLKLSSDFFWTQHSRVLELKETELSGPAFEGTAFGTAAFLGDPRLDLTFHFNRFSFDEMKKVFPEWFLTDRPDQKNWELSGTGSGTLILKGTLEKLLVNLDAGLNDSVIQIPDIGRKPSGYMLAVALQGYLSGSRVTEGEFDVNFGAMTVKGVCEKLDLGTRIGEINFISNKFPLAPLNGLVDPLKNFEMSGEAKMVANLKGDFDEPRNLKFSSHLTLDKISLKHGGERLFESLSGAFDFDLEKISVQKSELVFGASVIQWAGEVREFNAPVFQGRLSSPNLVIEDIIALNDRLAQLKLASASGVAAPVTETAKPDFWQEGVAYAETQAVSGLPPQTKVNLAKLPPVLFKARGNLELDLARVSWQARQLQNISGRIAWNLGELWAESIKANLGSGVVVAGGNATWKQIPPRYSARLESQAVPLHELTPDQRISGFADSSCEFAGVLGSSELMQDSLSGQGVFRVRDGAIQGISLLGTLSTVTQIVGMAKGGKIGAGTQFDELTGEFQIANRRVLVPNIYLRSDVVNAAAQGSLGFDETLKFQGVAELGGGLSGVLGAAVGEGEAIQFPLSVEGTIRKPKLNISKTALGTAVVQRVLGGSSSGVPSIPYVGQSSSGSSTEKTVRAAASLLQSLLKEE